MSEKTTNSAMIATVIASIMFVFIFVSYPTLTPSVANAAKIEAMDEENMDNGEPKDENAGKQDEEDGLKLVMDMMVMAKEMEDVLMNDSNRVRFFDPDVNKGLIDKDLLIRLMLLQEGLLDELDKREAELGEKVEEEDVEIPEFEDEEQAEAKELDDEELLKLALDMKIMDKELGKLMAEGDSDTWTEFDPIFNTGFLDRPFLGRTACLGRSFVDAFDNPFTRFTPFCPDFPRPIFFRPPFFRPPFFRPPFGPIGGFPFAPRPFEEFEEFEEDD